eukprot:m.109814 g.109814  ORF g.109814 m.109814 type:complete len:317 (+) comp21284_c0_seq1:145-1095(+)
MDGTGGVYLPKWLLRASLYSAGPFFCYPHKPLFALLEGSGYSRSYAHFRRDHQNPTNLVLHCFALVYQLGSNFALLNELDNALRSILRGKGGKGGAGERAGADSAGESELSPVAQTTAVLWAVTLLTASDAPLVVRLASATAVAAAYNRRRAFSKSWREVAGVLSIAEAITFHMVVRRRPLSHTPSLILTIVARAALQKVVMANRGEFAPQRAPLTAAVLAAVVYASLSAKTKLNVFRYALVAGPLSVLTDQKWLYFWSCAYQASLLQGAAHRATGELATLPQLNEHVADEFGHTTYFPNLLLQSVYESLTSIATA